jgi:hypothetical protein
MKWTETRAGLLESTGTAMKPRLINSGALGTITIPMTNGFTTARASEYKGSPRPKSIPRRLLNTFLNRIRQSGLFKSGRWIDVGGTSEYLDWLGVPADRRDILNLPGVPTITIEGDFNRPETMKDIGGFQGLLCLNCLLMADDPKAATGSLFKLLEPGMPFIIGFNYPHFWYVAPDGEHKFSYNPLNVHQLVSLHSDDFVIFPLGNLFQGFLEYYADRPGIRRLFLSPLLRRLAMTVGRLDREGTTSMLYMAVGVKR